MWSHVRGNPYRFTHVGWSCVDLLNPVVVRRNRAKQRGRHALFCRKIPVGASLLVLEAHLHVRKPVEFIMLAHAAEKTASRKTTTRGWFCESILEGKKERWVNCFGQILYDCLDKYGIGTKLELSLYIIPNTNLT